MGQVTGRLGFRMARGKTPARNTMIAIYTAGRAGCSVTLIFGSILGTPLTSSVHDWVDGSLSMKPKKNHAAIRANRENTMNGLYTLSRGLAIFFGFTVLLSVLWFASSLGKAFIIAGLLMGFSSLVAGFIPQRKLSSGTTRRSLVVLCVVGIGAGLVLVADDLGTTSEIEWDVIAIRLLHIAALATIAVTALKRSPEST